MDEITKGLLQLVESKDLLNWEVAINLVTTMDINYKYQLLYMFKKQIPSICARCNQTFGEYTCNKLDIIVKYIENNNLTTPNDVWWIDKYIKGTNLESVKQEPCCPNSYR